MTSSHACSVIRTSGSAAADSAHMLLKLAIAGVGVIRFGDIIVAQAIRDGQLMPVLEDWQEPESFPLWALQAALVILFTHSRAREADIPASSRRR